MANRTLDRECVSDHFEGSGSAPCAAAPCQGQGYFNCLDGHGRTSREDRGQ